MHSFHISRASLHGLNSCNLQDKLMRILVNTPNWLAAHRDQLARHGATLLLLAALILVGRSLMASIRAPKLAASQDSAPGFIASPQVGSAVHAANIANVHLFGAPSVATQAAPVALASDMSLTGILYSTSPEESRAIVVVGSDYVVGGKGTRLPNGGVIIGVAQDRILVNQGRNVVSVLLDIKKADPNALFPKVAVNGVGANGALANYAPMSGPADGADSIPKMAPVSNVDAMSHQIVHGDFLPLSAIRGSKAASHFAQMPPPQMIDRGENSSPSQHP